MKNYFKFSIPKPCHEDWGKMTPNEKGRFCDSCAKTVVNFTKKSTQEIQDYLVDNNNQSICGHFYSKQLDSITIEIPNAIFNQQLSFRKLFIVAAFFAMGTTLFSCTYSDGKKQKIENVIVIDSLITKAKDSLDFIEIPMLGGLEIIETDGKIVIEEIEEEEEIIEDVIIGMVIEKFPRFIETKKISKEEATKYFNNKISEFVKDRLIIDSITNLDKGKYKFYAKITIDSIGKVSRVNVKGPNKSIKKKIKEIFQKLPQLIPGKQMGKNISSIYQLPISFVVE